MNIQTAANDGRILLHLQTRNVDVGGATDSSRLGAAQYLPQYSQDMLGESATGPLFRSGRSTLSKEPKTKQTKMK
jgi:hypothetical protein